MEQSFALDHDPTRWGVAPGAVSTSVPGNSWSRRWVRARLGTTSLGMRYGWHLVGFGTIKVAGLRSLLADDAVDLSDAGRRRFAGGLSYLDLLARRSDSVHAADAVVFPTSGTRSRRSWPGAAARGVAAVTFGGGTSVVGGVRTEGLTGPRS